MLQSSPPENTRDSTRVFIISGETCFDIGVRLVLVSLFRDTCRMCYFTSQARKAVLASCVLLSQLDNDCLEWFITLT